MGADEIHVDAAGDHRFECGVGSRRQHERISPMIASNSVVTP